MNDLIPIIYGGGAYGSYLYYILNNIHNKQLSINRPFGRHGNSHMNSSNHMIFGPNDTVEVDIIDNKSRFIKVHPKNQFNVSVSSGVDIIKTRYGRSIMIVPTQTTIVLSLNNFYYKVWENFYTGVHQENINDDIIFNDNLYNGWGVDRNIPHNEIQRWVLREFLSLYLIAAWYDQFDWFEFDPYKETNIHLITVDDLLFDFSNTMVKLTTDFDLPYENVSEIHDIHTEMLELQEHKHKDKVTSTIIDMFLSNTDYNYSDIKLSIVDEAWIQYSLRENGYELLCDGMNEFPKTVKELIKKSSRN